MALEEGEAVAARCLRAGKSSGDQAARPSAGRGECRTTARPSVRWRSRSFSQRAWRSYPTSSSSASRAARTSATMGSCQRSSSYRLASDIACFLPQKLVRSTKNGRLIPGLTADSLDQRPPLGVGDVRGIPGQEKSDTLSSRDCDVKRIGSGLGGQGSPAQDLLRQTLRQRRDIQGWQTVEESRPASRGIGVTGPAFQMNELRDHALEILGSHPPPLMSDLLPPGRNEVPAWPSRQVADDGGFQVDAGLHG
jgi:hypothetical protein